MPLVLRAMLIASVACLVAACSGETALTAGRQATGGAPVDSSTVDLSTDDAKILYMLGQYLGQSVQDAALTEDELQPVFAGLADSALGRDPRVDVEQYGSVLPIFMQQRILAATEAALDDANAFLEEQAALDGATRTESGIVILPLVEGTGDRPQANDTVTVHYHGTLTNGRVFDSSVERDEPATMSLTQVIPCWQEGMQSMQVGGKSRLVCPPGLAYGPAGVPGIPGNSALIFEIELLEIAAD